MEGKSLLTMLHSELSRGDIRLPCSGKNARAVLQAAQAESPSTKSLTTLITREQGLCAEILSMANSGFFSGLNKVHTVGEALRRLDYKDVAHVAENAVQNDLSNHMFSGFLRQINVHALGCAYAAYHVARCCGHNSMATRTLYAGLLHDTGKPFVLTAVQNAMKNGDIDSGLNREVILEATDWLHAEQGAEILSSWSLPKEFVSVARRHHDEEIDNRDVLGLIVRLANILCRRTGLSFNRDASTTVPSATPEAFALGISEIELAELEVNLEESFWGENRQAA